MKNFHGAGKRKSFFEGWYVKHTAGDQTVALIPAYHVDENGKASASLQVITKENSYFIPYRSREFRAFIHQLRFSVGCNVFDKTGMSIDIATADLRMSGTVLYGPMTPIRGNIMGPFSGLPMQCNHGIVSMGHRLSGSLTINGQEVDFTGGVGYMEKDWGSSFPKEYLWTQANHGNTALFLSAAHIPFGGTSFQGCICAVVHEGREYRIATYRGAKIARQTDTMLALRQGRLQITAELLENNPIPLKAPNLGGMGRTIHESAACTVRYVLQDGERVVFDFVSHTAGFETGK